MTISSPTLLSQLYPNTKAEDEGEDEEGEIEGMQQLIAHLSSIGILTDVDLIFTSNPTLPPSLLSAFRFLQSDVVSTSPLLVPSSLGSDLLFSSEARVSSSICIPTLLPPLDAFLPHPSSSSGPSFPYIATATSKSGGYPPSSLITLSSPPSLYPLQAHLVLSALISHLLLNEIERALWIDTHSSSSGAFDPLQALSIALHIIRSQKAQGREVEEEEMEKVALEMMERIEVIKAFEKTGAVEAVEKSLETEQGGLKIVVVDQVTALLIPPSAIGEAKGGGSQALAQSQSISFLRRLTSLSRSQSLSIFLLNAASPSHLTPALGSSFTYEMDLSIWLAPSASSADKGGKEKRAMVEVRRNRRGGTGGVVRVLADGVEIRALH